MPKHTPKERAKKRSINKKLTSKNTITSKGRRVTSRTPTGRKKT